MNPIPPSPTTALSKVTVVILAGGKSTRMGEDKALIQWRGETLLARTVRLCAEAGLPVTVVGRDRPEGWTQLETLFLCDETAYQGPLGGVMTGLRYVDSEYILALGCDMPLLDAEAIYWLLNLMQQTNSLSDGLVVESECFLQPLFSIYARKSLALMQKTLAQGRRSLKATIEAGNFVQATAPAEIAAKLVNINTREDYLAVSASHGIAL